MTDKLYPLWINDRLPTKEDGESDSWVFVFFEGEIKVHTWRGFEGYNKNPWEYWCVIPDEYNDHPGVPIISWLATPQECLDREQGEDKKNGVCYSDPDQNVTMADNICGFAYPVETWIDIARKVEKLETENIDLEQALAQVKEENRDLAKAWKTLKDFNDETDNQEDERIDDLEQALAKSEEDREAWKKDYEKSRIEVDKYYNELKKSEERVKEFKTLFEIEQEERQVITGYLEETNNENQALKKLLIKEWE